MLDTNPVIARPAVRVDVGFAKLFVIANGVVPLVLLAFDAWRHELGANAVNYAIRTTGLLGLLFLVLSLLVTPLRTLSGWSWLIGTRRALGLFGFFYIALHFAIFFGLDRGASIGSTVHEILARRYLQIGTSALVLMIPLALTSTDAMVTRLGAKRWKRLHRLTYVVAIGGALHYYLLVKADVRQPLVFAGLIATLLGYRLVRHYVDLRTAASTASRRTSRGPQGAHVRPVSVRPRFWSGELRVARTFDETPDVRTFRLVASDGGKLPFDHRPGQYLNLALTIDGARVNRSYTIASSPTQSHYCELTVKRDPKGRASRYLHDTLREGDLLHVSAPAGRFVFDGADSDAVVLLAGGVGITPLMSVARYLVDQSWPGDIHFIIGARREPDLIFREELAYLQRRHPRLHVMVTLSGEDGSGWAGARGHIDADLLRLVPDLAKKAVFLCGPDRMMSAVQMLLAELGVPPAQVHTEAFVSPPEGGGAAELTSSTEVAAGPDATNVEEPASALDAGGAMIRFQRSERTGELAASATILEAAEDAGVAIPFECRSGICGQCKIKLVKGRVTMEVEDALSAADRKNGLILACQARAARDVIVDI